MASGKLNALGLQCTLLSSSKITEQNKGLDGLKLYLKDAHVIGALNAMESKKGPSWNYVFQVIFDHLRRESDNFIQQSSTWAATKKANKVKRLQDVFGLIRTCICVANTGIVRLSRLSSFVEFLITLQNENIFMSITSHGNTMVNILSENILVERKYYCDLSMANFNSLFEICKRDLSESDDSRKFASAALLYALTKVLVLQADCNKYLHLHPLFVEFGKTLKDLNSNNIKDNVTSSINLYVKWISVTNRTMACQLGEECLDTILGVWMGNTLPESTLNLIIEFCLTQLHLHNPGENTAKLTGAYAGDNTIWHGQIFMIFRAVEMQLNKQSSSLIYRFKSDKNKIFSERYIHLAACACYLLFQLNTNDNFQGPSCHAEQLAGLPSSKINFFDKSSLSLLFTTSKDKQLSYESKYWLQILFTILERHPHFFEFDDVMKVTARLRTLLLDVNLDSIGSYGFTCMSMLLNCFCHCFPCYKISEHSRMLTIWKDCWNIAANYLAQSNRRILMDSAFELLSSLVNFDRRLGFEAFISSGCSKSIHTLWSSIYMHAPPCLRSLHFVSLFLRSYGFLCSDASNTLYRTFLLTTSVNANFNDFKLLEEEPLKALLLHWLLGYQKEITPEKITIASKSRINATLSSTDDAVPPKPMVLLNLTSHKFYKDSSIDVEEIASFLFHICIKNSTKEKLTGSNQGFICMECDPNGSQRPASVIQLFDLEHVSFAKLLFLARSDLDEGNNTDEISTSGIACGKSFQQHVLKFVYKFLLTDLQVLATRINEVRDEENSSNIDKLCHSFFTIASISGQFLKLLATEKQKTEHEMTLFEEWMKSIVSVLKLIMGYINKRTSLKLDFDFVSVLLTDVKNVVSLFSRLLVVFDDEQFLFVKQGFQALVIKLFELVLSMLRLGKDVHEGHVEQCAENTVEDICHTQSTSSSTGYKRRRYDVVGGDLPAAKQKRYSLNNSENACNCGDALCDCALFHSSAISFLYTIIVTFNCGNLFNKVVTSVLCLDVTVFSNVRLVYKTLIQLSTSCKTIKVGEVTDVLDVFQSVFRAWYKDQYVCFKFLIVFSEILNAFSDCTNTEMFSAVFDKAVMILKTFWRLSIKGKCAPNVRLGVLACLAPMLKAVFRKQPSSTDLSILSTPDELDLCDWKLICFALISSLSDRHDGLKFSCSFVLRQVFSILRGCDEFQDLQKATLTCISKIAQKFFNELDYQSDSTCEENLMSFLSASLNALFVCFPPRSTEIEEYLHYELCLLSYFCSKKTLHTATLEVCNCLLMGYFKRISVCAFKTKEGGSDYSEKNLMEYASRHLQSLFSRWIQSGNELNVGRQIKSFPYAIFGCGSIQELFQIHRHKLFPVVFIYCNSKDELVSVFKSYLQRTEQTGNSLKDITKECAAEILSLVLLQLANGNTNGAQFEKCKSMFNKILQSENALFVSTRLHFAQILIAIIMKHDQTPGLTDGNNNLNIKINLLLKCCHSGTGKVAKRNVMHEKLADTVFCRRSDSCILIEVFAEVRKHIEEAWHPYELCYKMKVYKFFISTLLQVEETPEEFYYYLMKDVVYFLSCFVHSLGKKFNIATKVTSKKAFIEVSNVCLDIFILLCEYLKRNSCTPLENAFSHWSISVPFVSSIEMLKSFLVIIFYGDSDLRNAFESTITVKLDSVMALTLSMPSCTNLQNLLALIGWSKDSLNLGSCLEMFLNSFKILRDHGLIHSNNPMLNLITDNFAKTLVASRKSSKVRTDDSMSLKEKIEAMRFLTALSSFGSCNSSVFDCISEMGMLLPKYLNMDEETLSLENAKLKLINGILEILSRQVVSVDFKIMKDAVNCLYQFFQLRDMESFCRRIKEESVLMNALIPFQIELDASLRTKVVPKSIGELKTFFMNNASIDDMPFKDWICQLTCELISYCNDNLFHVIKPACYSDDALCSAILPAVFHDLLVNDQNGIVKQCLSSFVQNAFDAFLQLYKGNKAACMAAMQTLLGLIQFLQCQNVSDIEVSLKRQSSRASDEHPVSSQWANNFWLDVNYLSAANVAVICGKPFEAILFIEIWKECNSTEKALRVTNGGCRALLGASNKLIKAEAIHVQEVPNHDKKNLIGNEKCLSEEILIVAFSAIDDVDSLYGLRKNCHEDSKIMMHIHEKQADWFEALHAYDSQVLKSSTQQDELPNKILMALGSSGLRHISRVYKTGFRSQRGFGSDFHKLEKLQYKAAEKSSKWEDSVGGLENECFKQRFLNCVTLMMEEDITTLSVINELQIEITKEIPIYKGSFLINNKVISSLSNLMSLKDLANVYNLLTKKDVSSLQDLLNAWEKFFSGSECIMTAEYNCTNSILSNRDDLIKVLSSKFTDPNLVQKLQIAHERIWSQQVFHMINQRCENVALQKIADLKQNLKTKSSTFGYHKLLLEEAQLLWDMGKKNEAISISVNLEISLKNSLVNTESSKFGNTFLLGKALLLRGRWLNTSRLEAPSTILESYFKKSVEITERLAGKKDGQCNVNEEDLIAMRISGYKVLAKFADDQYQDVINYMTSSEFEHKRELFREAQKEIHTAEAKAGQNPKYEILLKRNSSLDHKDLQDILEKKDAFLLCALQNYINCLSLSDEDDILIYRVCALWFANKQSPAVPGLMECACKHIKTHKFVQTAYQLAARLNTSTSDVKLQGMLHDLLYRMAIDHPHHVLSVLLALANAQRDNEYLQSNTKRGDKVTQNSTTLAAKAVVAKVKSSRPHHVSLLEDLSSAYIQLANHDATRWAKMLSVPIKFEKKLLITRYCSLSQKDKYSALAIPTVGIPVDKSCIYGENGNFVSLSCFKPHFLLIGGINLPKILVAIGSDGRERKHLVKGKDDLRQDAVMQQVFKVVNNLMFQEKSSKGLQLRTYKVVPLSQRSGLVEWCEGTIPIGTYLIGTPALKDYGAHHRYRPKDRLSIECRKKLMAVASKPLHLKLESFKDICANFKPVFRHFFYEHFLYPVTWFDRRSAYCKSVACSSIVGYILGLGDRHVQNILVDRSTGEVIHIDLGVAFEQGRCLPTPEMVPFRLTRDMVDGFGAVGVEGPFRRNCERTMTVLRDSIDTISTIVEVLLHDPLHDWMMTSGKVLQLQRNTGTNFESEMTSSILNASTVAELLNETIAISAPPSNRSSLAGRAMLRVQEKLRGLESDKCLAEFISGANSDKCW